MEAFSYRSHGEASNPSFSSTLLDAIYRSIDEGDGEMMFHKETKLKKLHESSDFQKECMIEKWMEKDNAQKGVSRRRSLADFVPKVKDKDNPEVFYSNSSWSSSDSSSFGGFSSSEADDSVQGASSRSSCYGIQRPKPVRTSGGSVHEQKQNHGKTTKLSRALKMYADLKKANKQPISPGGKLASFLNNLLGNAKKGKSSSSSERKSKSANASTCSSASSFSRSCLSKTNTPSSRGKSTDGIKRSVRFYPVSVIVDEDCQPCGHKKLHEEKIVAGEDLLRNYQKRADFDYGFRTTAAAAATTTTHLKNHVFDEDLEIEEEEEDDDASYASSDLFELDNLSAIGNIERYREELPVYETTRLDTNRAIASGMIL